MGLPGLLGRPRASRPRAPIAAVAAMWAALAAAGCGFQVRSADLFLLTRTGAQGKLTLLVNDGGTIRCNGAAARSLPDPALIQARDLADNVAREVQKHARFPAGHGAVDFFTVSLQQGTISFPDTAGARDRTLAQAELFATRSAEGVCAGHR